MGDHFLNAGDWFLSQSTLEIAIESESYSHLASEDFSSNWTVDTASPRELVECKICYDEDEDLNMEMPCSCRGSLKYAHRVCVQRWCNEKGNTICEICQQQFKPGYTEPPPTVHYDGIFMDLRDYLRGNWEIHRSSLHNPEFLAMDSTDHNFSDSDIDEYPSPSSRSLIYCRIFAISFLMLRTVGILLPIYIMVMDNVVSPENQGPNWVPTALQGCTIAHATTLQCTWGPNSEPKFRTEDITPWIKHLLLLNGVDTSKNLLASSLAHQTKKTTYRNSSLGCINSVLDNFCKMKEITF